VKASARDLWALTKPGITRHVVLTAAAGYSLGSSGPFDWPRFSALLLGTALVSGGTNALNQWWEREADARMPRTRNRPLAARRLSPSLALHFALAIGALGVALLFTMTNGLTALLAALTLASYVLAYTPLKTKTTLNTLVGCVPGALPILGGWTAASGALAPGAWALFAILYLWQLPHTLALAWLYREDYRAGGLVMVGGDDATGRVTALKASGYAALLLAASPTPALLGVTHVGYAVPAAALGTGLLVLSGRWALHPAPARARTLFLATVGYLPVVLAAAVVLRR
jgi:protoheme IX farnesyltransferase